MTSHQSKVYQNPSAKSYHYLDPQPSTLCRKLHETLPEFKPSPLVPLPELAKQLNVRAVFVKDESSRLGLPAFKILGASWAIFRAITQKANLPLDSELSAVAASAQRLHLTLYAATAGNHGRAVARTGKLLSIPVRIYVPNYTDQETKDKIASEGAEVTTVDGDYDLAVQHAWDESERLAGGLLIQDNAFEGYEEIPRWIVEGYSTLLQEVEQQLAGQDLVASIMVTPIGVGSLGNAVVAHCKWNDRNITVLTVEPDTAACLNTSLWAGESVVLKTSPTIMNGMNCGTVSPTSWPALRDGVDASVTITDKECHLAIGFLRESGIEAGPCGAGAVAALQKIARLDSAAIGLNSSSVIVLLSTEGKRGYIIPQ